MEGTASTVHPRAAARLFWLCFAVAMVDGFDTLVVSFIAPAFAAEWSLTGAEVGQVFGAGLIGAALGGVVAGRLADVIGRKAVLVGSVAWFAALTVACAIAPGRDALMALRFCAGLGLGGAIPTITALVAETLPPERRAAAVTRMFLGFPLGAVVGGSLCAAMIDTLGWRSAFWLGGLLGFVLLPFLVRIVRETAEAGHGRGGLAGSGSVLREGRAARALLLFAAAFLILLVSYFLINWTPSILVRAGIPETQAIVAGVLLNLGGIVGALALTTVLDRSPYRLAGCSLLLGAVLIVALGANLTSLALAVPLVIATGMAVIGGQLALPALASALFPRAVRATGVGLTMGIGRVGSIVGPSLGGFLVDAELGWSLLFLVIAAPAALAGLSLLLCGWRSAPVGGPHEPLPGFRRA